MRFELSRRARSVLGVTGWLAAAAAATTVGVLVVGAIGTGIVGSTSRPLSSTEVDRALATASATPSASPSATASPSASATPSGPTATPTRTRRPPSGEARVLGSPGGTVLARCAGGQATLVSWSPRQGYEADDVHRGPDREASVRFESKDRKVRVRVSCAGGVPRADVESEADD